VQARPRHSTDHSKSVDHANPTTIQCLPIMLCLFGIDAPVGGASTPSNSSDSACERPESKHPRKQTANRTSPHADDFNPSAVEYNAASKAR
jgi:hypothetical protein